MYYNYTKFQQYWTKHKKVFICACLTDVSPVKVLLSTKWIQPKKKISPIEKSHRSPTGKNTIMKVFKEFALDFFPHFSTYSSYGVW